MDYINREISWLSFNERVLQESMDENVPLSERMRFLGIYSNNMDEFYRVRVANLKRAVDLNDKKVQGFKGTPEQLFEKIRGIVIRQQKDFEKSYARILDLMEQDGIRQFDENTVSVEQKHELQYYFRSSVIHDLVPIMLDRRTPFPRLHDKSNYLAVKMEHDEKRKVRYALIEIPSSIPRFYVFQDKGFIILDDIVRLNLDELFPIFEYDSIEAFAFKFSRDAELNLDDDVAMSFIEKMEKSIRNRRKGEPVRLVFDHRLPEDLLDVLLRNLNLKHGVNTIAGGKYHNFKDFMDFPSFGRKSYVFEDQEPHGHPALENHRSLIKQVQKEDVLLHFPYQRFDHVVDLIREAAIDPKVVSIKINVYRVAKNSQVLNALINAVSNGKEVHVVLELQARFDEENNIHWADRLKEIGARVSHGYEEIKIHSKLLQIKRISEKREQYITFVGTGNFNERSAHVYTDLGLLTADKKIGNEVSQVFQMMEQNLNRHTFRHLIVSPITMRRKILALISQEIRHAHDGKPAGIRIKVNNITDKEIIDKLYEASEAGVKIRIIVRGVCCLVPGLKQKSKNIEAISIVDRYLEHARVLIFENAGKPLYYVTSADLMERNLDKRIEVGIPIRTDSLKEELEAIFTIQWADNVKARIIDKQQNNRYKKSGEIPVQSQQVLMQSYAQKELLNENNGYYKSLE